MATKENRKDNTTEEYLEAIFKLSIDNKKVRIATIAKEFNIRNQSASEKVKSLEKDGYITLDSTGIHLTEKGESRAKDVIRKHRLAERFLVDVLGLKFDEVHEEACLFEHVISEKVADALEAFLNYPEHCPHGHPIPDKHGNIEITNLKKLSELAPGDCATVKEIDESSITLLKQLFSLGILPECKIVLRQVAPFRSAFMIEVNNLCCYSIGSEIADKIKVKAG